MRAPFTVDGVAYESTMHWEAEQHGADELLIRPLMPSGSPAMQMVDRCDHCGRCDFVPVVYHSWREAVDAGLFVPVESGAAST